MGGGAWGYLKGVYAFITADTGVDSFRDMVHSAGETARTRWKNVVTKVNSSRKLSLVFSEAGDKFRKENSLSELFKSFDEQKRIDYSEDSMSHRGKKDVEVTAKSKVVKKTLEKSGVVSTKAMKVMAENGQTEYLPMLHEQGDTDMLTRRAQQLRRNLRKSDKIKLQILNWWKELGFSGYLPNSGLAGLARYVGKAALKKKRADDGPTTPRGTKIKVKARQDPNYYDEEAETGVISKAEYVQMCVEIWKVVDDRQEYLNLSEADIRKSAAKDWKEDAQGQKAMTFPLFFNAIFQLCDLYTATAEEEEYEQFLVRCLRGILRNRKNVPICKKDDEE